MNVKGQVTIPKRVREALHLFPGDCVDFDFTPADQVVIRKSGARVSSNPARFDNARGKAQVKWRTDELMTLLRGRD
jgi:AbrB family looped-hinge helix DNA binding protein